MTQSTNNMVSLPQSDTPSSDRMDRVELGAIDASTRLPVIFFIVSSLLWLLVGTAFAFIASHKLHTPGFFGEWEWLTFGRVRTAHLNTVIYGWSINVSFAVAFWLMARLSRAVLRYAGILIIAGVFWNIGVTLGVVGILKGDMTSVEWLEFPSYVTPLLFAAYALVGAWAIATFRFGQSKHIYVSQWYILAALFWFPWLYSAAQIMLFFYPAGGTVQALVNWWYTHNLIGLWITPIGLGAIYYFLPKVLGKPIHSYFLSMLGFWALVIFYSWAGVNHLIGGPVPAWVITIGIAASFMMIVPVVVTTINYHLTLFGSFSVLKHSPTLRFIVFGAVSYTITSLVGVMHASRTVNETLHFTHFTVAHAHQGMYAFFTMVMFGAIYYIMPRLLLREWPSAMLIRVHFWAAAVGIIVYVVGMSIGGIIQGWMLNAVNAEGELLYPQFIETMKATIPWIFSRSVTGILMAIGHIAFAVNLGWMFLCRRAPQTTQPTRFRNASETEVSA